MTVDEWAIRDTARDLANLYRELDAQKYAPPAPRETRVMKPRPGPSSPGNWFAMCLDADLVDHLVEMVCDARNHIEPGYVVGRDGAVLCDWIAWNAQPISELDFAADLHDLMVDQARRLTKRLHPPEPPTVVAPEKHIDIEAIVRNLTQRGHQVTARQARDVAVYNKFRLIKFTDGRNGYLLSEFLRHYEKRAGQ